MSFLTFFRVIVTYFVFCFGAFAAEPAEQLHAGLRIVTVSGGDPIPLMLFYPTAAAPRVIPMGPYSPEVAINGAPVEMFKGLILISHGTGGSQLAHYQLAQHLAQAGYLVAAPQHPHDNWQDRSLASSVNYFAERPRQLSRVLDFILENSEWAHKIPPGKIGAIGHSAGGFTVLALAGGVASPQRLAEHCKAPAEDATFCGFRVRPALGDAANDVAKPIDFNVRDSRIHAVMALAPAAQVFTPTSLHQITVPLAIYIGEKDEVLAAKFHGGWLHQELPLAEFTEVKNAGHFAFMSPLPEVTTSAAGNPNFDPPGFDRDAFQIRLANEAVIFFERSLSQ